MNGLKEFILKELNYIHKELITETNIQRIKILRGNRVAYQKTLEFIRNNDNKNTSHLTEEQCETLANLPTKQIVRVEYKTMTQEEIVELLNKRGKNNEN